MEGRAHLIGWLLFLLGCMTFLVSGVKSADPLAIAGGVLFTAGVMAFLLPFPKQ